MQSCCIACTACGDAEGVGPLKFAFLLQPSFCSPALTVACAGWTDEAAAPDGAQLDPWEQGYEVAEDEEQLPDADQLDGGGWQDGNGWQAADDWQDGGEEAMEEDAAAGGCEQQGQGDTAAEAAAPAEDDEGCWDDEQDAAEGAAPCPAVPAAAAARQPAPAQAAAGARLAGKRRSSGSAVEVPRAVSQRRQQQQLDGLDGGSQPMRHTKQLQRSPVQPSQQPGKAQAAAATPVGEASTLSSTLGLADLTVQPPSERSHQAPRVPAAAAAAPQQPARQPQKQQQAQQQTQQPDQPASPSALGTLAVPELEALSPSLLGAAPTLAEVLYSKPAATVLEAAAPAAAAVAVGGEARASGSSGRAVPRVPALRGAPQRPGPASGRGLRLLSVSAPAAAAARPATTPKPRAMEAAAPAAAAPAVSDDDMPSFALLDDMSPARPQLGAAPAAVSQDEPFTYLLQLQRRANSAGPYRGSARLRWCCLHRH